MNPAAKNKSKKQTLFNIILSIALLVQGVMFSQLVQCGDDHSASAAHMTAAGSHDEHMDMDANQKTQASAAHICPMGGCYECPAEECGQCSAAKLAVLVEGIDANPPHYIYLNHYSDNAPALLALDVLRLLPPGRAPPFNA